MNLYIADTHFTAADGACVKRKRYELCAYFGNTEDKAVRCGKACFRPMG